MKDSVYRVGGRSEGIGATETLPPGNLPPSMPRLEVRNMVMQFPAVRALDGVSLAFEQGEVHGIIGENGAGKSTLMRILSGIQAPTSGEILSRDAPVQFRHVGDALRDGIAMIHQELNLVDTLSAAENVFLGREPVKRGVLDRTTMRDRTAEYLGQVGARFGPDAEVGALSIAGKQLVEIAKALSYEANVLIMDEPTAVLSDQETANLFQLIGDLRNRGVTILYISHRLAEVETVCDRITVLRDGVAVRTVLRGEATQTELSSLMVGRPLGDMFPTREPASPSDPLLELVELADGIMVHGASLAVRAGEIVGLAGLIGSGRTELAEMAVGARRRVSGEVRVEGKAIADRNPREAAKVGLAYISEDRKGAGLVLGMSVIQNTTLANLNEYARPILDRRKERRSAEAWKQKLDIRANDLDAAVLYLSGGNQQKVAIAKWLEMSPKILILDEPTRGVDVGAKREIYNLIHGLAKEGMGCLVISSELPELIGLCHRIAVMRNGRIVGEIQGDEATEEAIMFLAAGVEAA